MTRRKREEANQERLARRAARIVQLATNGCTTREIAAEVGVHIRVIHYTLSLYGVHALPRISRELMARAVDAVRCGGCTVAEAAAAHGISIAHLARGLRAQGVRSTARSRRHGRVAKALERVRNGETIAAACAAEGCAPSTLYARSTRARLTAIGEAAERARANAGMR